MSRVLSILMLIIVTAWATMPPQFGRAARTDRDLAEMPYVASYATDIFVASVESIDGVEDTGDTNKYFPRFDTVYSVLIEEVIKGALEPGNAVQVRQLGAVVDGKDDFRDGDGPMAPGETYLFATSYWSEQGVYRIALHLDGSILLETEADRIEWIGRWATAVEAGPCNGYLDVLRLNGAVYARRSWNGDKRFLEPEWVGELVATIERQDYALYGCSPDLQDGDASLLASGTEVFELKGYDPSFRVAVRLPDKHRWLYEAVWSDSAQTGEDLLDIKYRVVEVAAGRSSFCNDKGCVDYALGYSEDPIRINGIVALTLRASVQPVEGGLTFLKEEEVGYIYFVLDDGSTTGIHFDIATGITTNGIYLPTLLVELILRGYDTPDGF